MYVKCSQPATQAEFTCRIGYQSQIIITLSGVEWGDVVEKEKKMEKNSFFLLQTYVKFRSLLTHFSQCYISVPPEMSPFSTVFRRYRNLTLEGNNIMYD